MSYLETAIAVMAAGSLLSSLSNAVCMVSLLLNISCLCHLNPKTFKSALNTSTVYVCHSTLINIFSFHFKFCTKIENNGQIKPCTFAFQLKLIFISFHFKSCTKLENNGQIKVKYFDQIIPSLGP